MGRFSHGPGPAATWAAGFRFFIKMSQFLIQPQAISGNHTTMQTPRITAISRVAQGATIFFSDGSRGFYPNALLYRMLDSGEVRPVQTLDEMELEEAS
jgi:hypothetical protein